MAAAGIMLSRDHLKGQDAANACHVRLIPTQTNLPIRCGMSSVFCDAPSWPESDLELRSNREPHREAFPLLHQSSEKVFDMQIRNTLCFIPIGRTVASSAGNHPCNGAGKTRQAAD
jgi:hypothetical protein